MAVFSTASSNAFPQHLTIIILGLTPRCFPKSRSFSNLTLVDCSFFIVFPNLLLYIQKLSFEWISWSTFIPSFSDRFSYTEAPKFEKNDTAPIVNGGVSLPPSRRDHEPHIRNINRCFAWKLQGFFLRFSVLRRLESLKLTASLLITLKLGRTPRKVFVLEFFPPFSLVKPLLVS